MGPSRLPKRTARTGNTAGGDLLAYPSGVGAPIIMTLQQHQRGVTLLELLVAVAVLAIAASLAAPSFSDTIRNQRLSSRSFALQEDLAFARSEAVKVQGDVFIAAKAGGFTQGWVVFEDQNGNAHQEPMELTLREHGALPSGYHMEAAVEHGGPRAAMGFNRNGAMQDRESFGVVICAPGWNDGNDATHARNLNISANGRAHASKGHGHHSVSCG
ncbi:MAG: GspH/FimT family pseudopilin [Xanthomonadales bacterium]|nr:GspH/FimT family pseudopilin [Xanthomonadales bacterium]